MTYYLRFVGTLLVLVTLCYLGAVRTPLTFASPPQECVLGTATEAWLRDGNRTEAQLGDHCRQTWLSMGTDENSQALLRELEGAIADTRSVVDSVRQFEDTMAARFGTNTGSGRISDTDIEITVTGRSLTPATREQCTSAQGRTEWMQTNEDEEGVALEESCTSQFGANYLGEAPAAPVAAMANAAAAGVQTVPGNDGGFYGDQDPRRGGNGGGTVRNNNQTLSVFANPLRNIDTIPKLLSAILSVITVLAVPVVVFFIILAGFTYVTAQGNPTKIADASRALLYAIIGTVLIFGGMAISRIIQSLVDSFRA